MKLVVAVTGASGAPYAKRLLGHLRAAQSSGQPEELELACVFSEPACQVWDHEVGTAREALGVPVYGPRDFSAPFASGSAGWDAMVVIPCSMGTLGRIAQGVSDDLIGRAADVMLKERRTLVLVPRETPYSAIHIENMRRVLLAGALVLPASPSFYGRPTTIDDLLDTVVGRVVDRLGLRLDVSPRWGTKEARL